MFNEFRLKMLNREASSPKNEPSKIIETLDIKDGMVIGDIGSGGGYFAREFSREVGKDGQIYAIDVNQKSLDFIVRNLKKDGINNVKPLLANQKGFSLLEKTIDLFFLRNVFHHLSEQAEYFKNIKKFLKEDGRIAILDYKEKKLSFTGFFGHYTPENVLIEVMDDAGFYPLERHDFLQDQLFIIFAKKS